MTCRYGHPWPEFLYVDPRGKRQCRECRRLALKRWYDRTQKVSAEEQHRRRVVRFMAKVIIAESGCWIWPNLDEYGYGNHRGAWKLFRDKDPPKWPQSLDHLCRVRACANPDHLEVVSISENTRRGFIARPERRMMLANYQKAKTHCPQGHPLSGENLRIDGSSGARRCRICDNAKARRYKERQKMR